MTWARGGSRTKPLPKNWNAIRRRVLARDRVCRVCRVAPSVEVDHITPGGRDTMDNLQGLCRRCHGRKTAREGRLARSTGRRPADFRPPDPHPGERRLGR